MQWAAELDFALDIDDLAASQSNAGGNTARVAKRETAEGHHRETIDLADLFAIGLDSDGLAADLFLQAAIDPIAAAELRINSVLHLCCRDGGLAAAGCQLIGLLQEIDDLAQPGGQPIGIAYEPCGPLDDPRHCTTVERQELFAAHHAGDEARIEQGRLRRALDTVVEIRSDLEKFFEIVVGSAQQ